MACGLLLNVVQFPMTMSFDTPHGGIKNKKSLNVMKKYIPECRG